MNTLPSIPLPAEMNFLEVTPGKPCPTLIIWSFWIQSELEPVGDGIRHKRRIGRASHQQPEVNYFDVLEKSDFP